MNSLAYEVVATWELAAIALTLLISSYLLLDLLAGLLSHRAAARFPKRVSFPMVSVVIPVYNEPSALVRATLDSWRLVRYPTFEVIVADDSDVPLPLDDPTVRVLRRTHRDGFKGGALRNAAAHVDAASEWMLVFDADFVVDPDVLVRFAEHYRPGVGGVQGYMSMRRERNPRFLSRVSESFHSVANVLLAGRHRLHGFVGVQGTVQAYRLEAVRSIGGIAPYTTANEDLDTTFRLRKAGWQIVYDPRIEGRGIPPDRYPVFFAQSTRWTSTTVREYRRHWASFLTSPQVGAIEKVDSFFFLLTWTNSLLVTPTLAFLPWALLFLHLIPLWLAISITALPATLFLIPIRDRATVRSGVTGWLGYYLLLLPGYLVMFRATLLGLFTEPGFVRTPKTVAAPSTGPQGLPSRRGSILDFGDVVPRRRAHCVKCGRLLSHREVLFYALGGLDVSALECRACLSGREWLRRRAPLTVA